MKRALIVVDVQRDFCRGGALPAAGCERILPVINQYLADALEADLPVYASRDWHPAVTTHFKAYGGEWPPHCVQGTTGAEFHPALKLPAGAIIVTKGDVSDRPGYSAFDGRTLEGKPLLRDLQEREIGLLLVAGLTTEYCVKQTALDALRGGLRVSVLLDAVAGIDEHPGDADRALNEMRSAGAEVARGIATFTNR
jgi:nicotinamidase/pyrazinamidase